MPRWMLIMALLMSCHPSPRPRDKLRTFDEDVYEIESRGLFKDEGKVSRCDPDDPSEAGCASRCGRTSYDDGYDACVRLADRQLARGETEKARENYHWTCTRRNDACAALALLDLTKRQVAVHNFDFHPHAVLFVTCRLGSERACKAVVKALETNADAPGYESAIDEMRCRVSADASACMRKKYYSEACSYGDQEGCARAADNERLAAEDRERWDKIMNMRETSVGGSPSAPAPSTAGGSSSAASGPARPKKIPNYLSREMCRSANEFLCMHKSQKIEGVWKPAWVKDCVATVEPTIEGCMQVPCGTELYKCSMSPPPDDDNCTKIIMECIKDYDL